MSSKKFVFFKTSSGQKVKIDKSDLARVSKYSWRVTQATTGRLRVVASLPTKNGYRTTTLGKFLMNPPKGKQVYPRRFNKELDYCKSNLIVCTLKERQRLLPKKRSQNTSKYRGVSFSKVSKKWRAGIQVGNKSINLGEYKSEKQAAYVYNQAAKNISARWPTRIRLLTAREGKPREISYNSFVFNNSILLRKTTQSRYQRIRN